MWWFEKLAKGPAISYKDCKKFPNYTIDNYERLLRAMNNGKLKAVKGRVQTISSEQNPEVRDLIIS